MAAGFAAAPVLTGILVGSTVLAAGAGIFSAVQGAAAAREQREAEKLREKQIALQGLQEGNEILEEQIQALAATNVASGASGVDPFSGSPQRRKDAIRDRANRQLRISRLNTAFGVAGSQSRQRQLSIEGRAALVGGIGGALGTAGSGAVAASRIG